MTALDISSPCQRWRERRGTYRPAGEPIDTKRLGVELIAERDAKTFITTHHYSGTYPAARLRVGLLRTAPFRKPELVGAAVFSVPMAPRAILHYTGQSQGVELGRFCLLDDIAANGETWFLARAFKLLATSIPDVKFVLSYSDPIPRQALDGSLVLPGHVGTVYQAANARYLGRSSARTLFLQPDGRNLSERALCKLRAEGSGADYAYAQLLAAGAPRRIAGESGAEYVRRALAEGPFRRFRHPGCHVYGFIINGTHAQRRAMMTAHETHPYPKKAA